MNLIKFSWLTIFCVVVAYSTNINVNGAEKVDINLVNMLSNSGVEEGSALAPVDWEFVNVHESVKGTWPEKEGYNGSKCLKLESLTGLSYGWWKTAAFIILEPGRNYTIGGMHRGDNASAKVQGFSVVYDAKSGKYERNIEKFFSTEKRISASKDWQKFENTFSTPDWKSPVWVEIMLQCGDNRKQALFDDVYLIGETFKLISPAVTQVVPPGGNLALKIAVCNKEAKPVKEISGWRAFADKTKLDITSINFDESSGLWNLNIKTPEKSGVYTLKIETDRNKNLPDTILKPKFLVVNQAENKFFAFAVFSDPHISAYSEDTQNNKLFLQVVAAVNGLDPLFVIGTGDLRGISSGFDDARIKYMCDSYKHFAAMFNAPVYNIGGNHDFDKTSSGVQSRWYFAKYMGYPLYFSFDVANFHFVGIDTNTNGSYGNDHLGSFNLPGQQEWLEQDLAQATSNGKFIVLFFHESLYEGAQFKQDENKKALENVIYKNNVKLVLEGHNHHNWIYAKKNPLKEGLSELKEINLNPDKDPTDIDVCKYYNDPLFTVFEQTATASAFLIREAKYFAFRYLVVRDGKIIFDDAIPISFKVNRSEDTPGAIKIDIAAGPEKPLKNLPLKIAVSPGKYKVIVNGTEARFDEILNGDKLELWVILNLKPNDNVKIEAIKQ